MFSIVNIKLCHEELNMSISYLEADRKNSDSPKHTKHMTVLHYRPHTE